jgi:hypothetical protein
MSYLPWRANKNHPFLPLHPLNQGCCICTYGEGHKRHTAPYVEVPVPNELFEEAPARDFWEERERRAKGGPVRAWW